LTLVAHGANNSDNAMKLPRYLLTNANKGNAFEWILTN
jgi:hypothetical protein